MADQEVIRIVDRNWRWRREAEMAERRVREQARRKNLHEWYRKMAQLSYVLTGGVGVMTMAAMMVGLPGWAAVAGVVATAVLFALGEAFEDLREGRRV